MLRRAHRKKSEVIANNPTCGKGRTELTTRNGSVTLSHERKKRKEYRYNEKSRGGEWSRLFDAWSVEERKPTFRVPAETSFHFGQLWIHLVLPLRLNVIASSRRQEAMRNGGWWYANVICVALRSECSNVLSDYVDSEWDLRER